MSETRSVFTLILAVMILQIAGGLLSMLTPLGLEALGTAPSEGRVRHATRALRPTARCCYSLSPYPGSSSQPGMRRRA